MTRADLSTVGYYLAGGFGADDIAREEGWSPEYVRQCIRQMRRAGFLTLLYDRARNMWRTEAGA